MLYYLQQFSRPGSPLFGFNLFRYLTFRAAFAAATAFIASLLLYPVFIRWMKRLHAEDDVSKPDSPKLDELHRDKAHTPTMGGIVLVAATVVATVLWAKVTSFEVAAAILVAVAFCALGVWDDVVKLRGTRKGKGLTIRTKLGWQLVIAACVTVFFLVRSGWWGGGAAGTTSWTTLDIPFIHDEVFHPDIGWLYFLLVVMILVGTSNAVNLSDGLDGLAGGLAMPVVAAYAVLAYVAGHSVFAEYLRIQYVPGTGELAVVCAAMAGSLLGFLWYNVHPAEIFMGDSGSLPVGGLIGFIALASKQELLLAVVGGVFVVEALSVMLQVASFRMFGRRVLRISPLHHHFQFGGWAETKIVSRFWIVSVLLALTGLVSLKIR